MRKCNKVPVLFSASAATALLMLGCGQDSTTIQAMPSSADAHEFSETVQAQITIIEEKARPKLITINTQTIHGSIKWEDLAKLGPDATAADLKQLVQNSDTGIKESALLGDITINGQILCFKATHHTPHAAIKWGKEPWCDSSIRTQMLSGSTPPHEHVHIYNAWNGSCDFEQFIEEDSKNQIANFHFYENPETGCFGGFEGKSHICLSSSSIDGLCPYNKLKKAAQELLAEWAAKVMATYGVDFANILTYLTDPSSLSTPLLVGTIILAIVIVAINLVPIAGQVVDAIIVALGGTAVVTGAFTLILLLPTVVAEEPPIEYVDTDCWDTCDQEYEKIYWGNAIIECQKNENDSCLTWQCIDGCSGDQTCNKQCANKECGDDKCGGSCGGCAPGYKCIDYQCVEDIKCGDGQCDASTENCNSCPTDCGSCIVCGNNKCEAGENCGNCSKDCDECPPTCGNKKCEDNESCSNCEKDCGKCCGDGVCDKSIGENPCTCDMDCAGCCTITNCPNCGVCQNKACVNYNCECKNTTNCCGNNICEINESYCNCAKDCSVQCGDGCCSSGESATNCSKDCQNCDDGKCNGEEDCSNCDKDCGECCGDGVCEATKNENCDNCWTDCECDYDEACLGSGICCKPKTCSELGKDCGSWPDGCDGYIDCPSCAAGYSCQNGKCILDCVNECSSGNTQCFDSASYQDCVKIGGCWQWGVAQDCGTDQYCQDGVCEYCDCTPGEKFCKDGDVYKCKSDCHSDSLYTNCTSNETCENNQCIEDVYCGNDNCDAEETYCTCSSDCLIECGDGCCSSGENYSNCPEDCQCNASCVGKKCGDDGCGESCGKCSLGFECINNQCQQECTSKYNYDCCDENVCWFDSCDKQEAIKEYCDCGCSGSACLPVLTNCQITVGPYWWEPNCLAPGETATMCVKTSGCDATATFSIYEYDLATFNEFVEALSTSVNTTCVPDYTCLEWQVYYTNDPGESEYMLKVKIGSITMEGATDNWGMMNVGKNGKAEGGYCH